MSLAPMSLAPMRLAPMRLAPMRLASLIAFLKDERAATAIEYGLIATGIAVAIIPVLTGVGSKMKTTFTAIQTALR